MYVLIFRKFIIIERKKNAVRLSIKTLIFNYKKKKLKINKTFKKIEKKIQKYII